MTVSMAATLLACLFTLLNHATALECIQCDRSNGWYEGALHEQHIEKCQNALIEKTRCANATHTHCIVSWYKSGGSSAKVITERRCGMAGDITGCTLYNSQRLASSVDAAKRLRRHYNDVDSAPRRTLSVAYVEVCSEDCPDGHCVNGGDQRGRPTSLLIAIFALLTIANRVFSAS